MRYTSHMSLGLFQPDAPKVPKVVAYLRSRPSEPDASAEAMFMQRELLDVMTRQGEIAVVAEFVEEENNRDDRPAYHAALRDAAFRGCALLTAGRGAIGTGPRFVAPEAPGPDVERIDVSVSHLRFPDLVPVPKDSPAAVALWADCRPPQGVTAIYLCNSGPDDMESIELTSTVREIGIAEGFGGGDHVVEPIPAGMARFLDVLFHDEWTFYSSYRIFYVSRGAARRPLGATDRPLNSQWLAEDPTKVWVPFRPTVPDTPVA